jgi:DNA-binding CsgD family transcriptional regulator
MSMLLDRGSELAAVQALVEAVRLGQAGIMLVEGSAGIGKTSLLHAAEAAARGQGVAVATAHCGELERGFAFGVVRQLFEPMLAAASEDERVGLLGGAAGLAMRVLGSEGLEDAPALGSEVPYAPLHGLYWLTANLAARMPLLLSVDDLHWADAPSLRFLAHLTRRLEGVPVALVCSLRSGEPPTDAALLDELMDTPWRTVLRPRALSEASVAALVRERLGDHADEAFCLACHAATGGNPFLVRELLRELADSGVVPAADRAAEVTRFGPEAVARAVLGRLRRLSPAAVDLARAVAVLGEAARPDLAAALAGLAQDEVAELAEALVRLGVLRAGHPLAFAHPIVRAAVEQSLSEGERGRAHARVAALLEAGGAPAEQVAVHVLAAPRAGDAGTVALLRAAARQALARGAPDVAVTYLRRALDEPAPDQARPGLLAELGTAELHVDPPAANEHLRQGFEATADPLLRAGIALRLTYALNIAGRVRDAIHILQQAIEGLGDQDRALALHLQSELLFLSPAEPGNDSLVAELLPRIGWPVDPDSRGGRGVLSILAMGTVSSNGSLDEATRLAEQALTAGALLEDDDTINFLFTVLVFAWADRLDEAERRYDEAIERARRRGSVFLYAIACALRSKVAYMRGAIIDAHADAQAAMDTISAEKWPLAVAFTIAGMVDVLIERGQLDEAAAALAGAGLNGPLPELWPSNMLLSGRGRLRMAQGDHRAALADFTECGRRMQAWGTQNPALIAWRSTEALALAALGDPQAARRLVAEEVELARQWGAARSLGAALRVAGVVAGGPEGIASLEEAVAVLQPSPARLEHARALVDLGIAVHRADQRDRARAALRQGLDLAHRCGASALAAQAHSELLATGARPRRFRQSGVEALTASEHQVATMAAAGRTNREIAQALFVTQRTVEIHLTNAYRKLAIAGRSELAAALDRKLA